MKQNGTHRGSLDHPLFEIRRSAIQGRGAFAKRRIRAGQKIVEYTGEKIDNDEADRRYDEDKMPRHHTFLFTLDDDTCIDDDRIWIYALKNIQPGVELAYDYKYERTGDIRKLEKFYVCRCGSPRCRGSIM